MLLTRLLGLAVLTVGVSVKWIVASVLLKDERNAVYVMRLQGIGVGCGLLLLYCIRVLHHGGRDTLQVGNYLLRIGDDAMLDTIVHVWWWSFALSSLVPFLMAFTMKDPIALTVSNAGLLLFLCILESFFVHLMTMKLKTSGFASQVASAEDHSLLHHASHTSSASNQ
jgi:hypothetical protein